jgi:hypothetical protein
MAYPEVEALIFTKLRSVTGFTGTTSTTENTSRGKWGLLNSGNSDHYAIIKPGEFERSQGAMSMNVSNFQTVIQVWQRYTDDGTSLTNLEGYVKAIIAYFDQWRRVGDSTGTIIDAFIRSGTEAQEMWNKDGGLSWLKQDLVLVTQEHDVISYGE